MIFGMYYVLGMAVIAWIMLLENMTIGSVEKLISDDSISMSGRFIILVGTFFFASLIWPIMVIWDVVVVIHNVKKRNN